VEEPVTPDYMRKWFEKRFIRIILLGGVLLVLILAAAFYLSTKRKLESLDNEIWLISEQTEANSRAIGELEEKNGK
jgi:hypothetical protein